MSSVRILEQTSLPMDPIQGRVNSDHIFYPIPLISSLTLNYFLRLNLSSDFFFLNILTNVFHVFIVFQ